MKKHTLLILSILIFTVQTFAQDKTSSSEFQQFSAQVSNNSSIEEIEKTTSEAEDFYNIKKKNTEKDQSKLANIVFDFSEFRQNIDEILTYKIKNTKKNDDFLKSIAALVGIRRKNFTELVNLYQEVIKIYKNNPGWEDLQIAKIKYKFARSQMILNPEIADISSRYGKRSMTWKEKRERLSDAQSYFSQTLNTQEKLLPENDDATLVTIFYFAQSLMESADFEKALFLYERYIAGIETKYGKKSQALLPALEISVSILQMIGDDKSVEEISQQLWSISGKKTETSDSLLFVAPRTKSFDYKGITGKDGVEVLDVQNYSQINPRSNSSVSAGVISSGGAGNLSEVGTTTIPFIGGNLKGLTKVIVVIDENGKVIEASALTENKKIKTKIEKEVLKWEFKPFVYKNERKKMKGIVYYFKK